MYISETNSNGRETLTLFNVQPITSDLDQSQRHGSLEQSQAPLQPATVRDFKKKFTCFVAKTMQVQRPHANQTPQVDQVVLGVGNSAFTILSNLSQKSLSGFT